MARKILLADDSVTAQNMGRKILADAGYEVVTVNNGSAALKKISEVRPDLIVLDVYMPGYSGLEVCQRLKETGDTARIPVLLTVGKLEPFKPEEAQRVRAEGFIVKPFEASELLSALTRLEDKVVPRSETSKPGRFARAIAAVEEASRGDEPAAEGEGSWKNRIAFPKKKKKQEKEAGESAADDASVYNAVNRDLRTVVETPAEKAGRRDADEGRKEEKTLDVAALVPPGLPKDATPEELAAIAAAAAQMQAKGAPEQESPKPGEASATRESEKTAKADTPAPEVPVVAETPGADSGATFAAQEAELSRATMASENTAAKDAAPASAAHDATARAGEKVGEEIREREQDSARREGEQEAPVTMAARATASDQRWMAIPVTLGADEALLSLEQEMQKAQVPAVPPAAAAPAPAVEATPEPTPASATSHAAEAVAEKPAEPERAMSAAVGASPFAVVGVPSVAAPVDSAPVAEPVRPVMEEPAVRPETTTELKHEVARIEPPETSADAQEPQPVSSQTQPAAEPEAATIAPVAASAPGNGVSAPEAAPDKDSEVASRAAAWASWRHIRDSDTKKTDTDRDFDADAPADHAAAVAAGAEKILQEASAAAPGSDPKAIASIVESVLADLRPKIVEEISRKLSDKKK